MLVRAAGPALTSLGVTGALADPSIAILDSAGRQVANGTNNDWETAGAAALTTAFSQAGAFPFAAGSRDSALVVDLMPGNYTIQVSGANNTKTRLRVFEQHVMPGSRLTADRFWMQQPGDTLPAAKLLADHFGIAAPNDVPTVAALAGQPAEVDPGSSGTAVRLSALQSRFASTYSWTLTQRPIGSNAVLVGAKSDMGRLQSALLPR